MQTILPCHPKIAQTPSCRSRCILPTSKLSAVTSEQKISFPREPTLVLNQCRRPRSGSLDLVGGAPVAREQVRSRDTARSEMRAVTSASQAWKSIFALAAPRQRYHERDRIGGLAADYQVGILGPVHLGLCPHRRLHLPPCPEGRCWKRPLPIALD